ncbi:MAG: hypothetical protein IJ017_08220 [Oscillospiraceae bacterium]|nr:hypothetical protein [Oscillospiraceae bacterium]
MKIFGYELYKIAKAKMFLGIIAVLFAFSLFVFGMQQNKITGYAEAKDIFEDLAAEYSTMDTDEAYEKLKLKYVEYDIRTMRFRAVNDGTVAWFMSMYEESYPKLYEEIMSSEEPLTFEDLENTRFAYWQLYENAKYILEYPEYIDNVQENAKTMTSVSIFAEKGSFTYNNILKTAENFEQLKDLKLSFGTDRGIVAVTDYSIGDIMLVVMVFVLCIFLFSEEQGSGMLNLIITSKSGRFPVITAKILSLITVTVVIGAAYIGAVYTYGESLYGFGDTSRYVQSMSSFQNCGTAITVKQFLIYSAITKISVLVGVGMFFSVIFVLFRGNAAMTYLSSILPMGIMWLAYTTVPPNAVFNHIKYLNPFNFLNTYGLYGKYMNISFFTLPVNVLDTLPIITAIVIVICAISSCIVFVKMRGSYRKNPFSGVREKISNIWRSGSKSTSLFLEEGFKLLVQGRVLVMLLAAAVIGAVAVMNYREPTFDVDELVYRKYMRNITGEATEDTFTYLDQQQAEFDNIPNSVAAYQAAYEAGKITDTELRERTAYLEHTIGMQQKGFEMVQQDAEYAKQNGTWFTDQITAKAWFGNTKEDITNGLKFVVSAIICLSPVFSMDYKRKARPILLSTKNGRAPLVRAKLLWSVVILLIIYISVYLPHHINLLKGYGTPEWDAPIQSVQLYENFSGKMTVLEFYVRTHILRFAIIAMLGMIFALISVKAKKQLIIILVSSVIFAVPLVLQQQGVDLRYFSFNNAFMLNSSFLSDVGVRKSIINLAAICIIGVAGAGLTFDDSETTKRRLLR